MPKKDDYLQRQLELIAETLAAIAGLRRQGQQQQALATIQHSYQQHFASSGRLIHLLSTEDLIAMLSTAQVVDSAKAYLLAELLSIEAELVEAVEQVSPWDRREKALNLYLLALLTDDSLEDLIIPKVTALLEQLDTTALRPASQRRLFDFYLWDKHFAKAEDVLFGLLEAGADRDILNRGKRFYRDLLALPEAELIAGGLPRDEVLEGQLQLRALEDETAP